MKTGDIVQHRLLTGFGLIIDAEQTSDKIWVLCLWDKGEIKKFTINSLRVLYEI